MLKKSLLVAVIRKVKCRMDNNSLCADKACKLDCTGQKVDFILAWEGGVSLIEYNAS